MCGQKHVEDARTRAYDPGIQGPAMTSTSGLHVLVAQLPVKNRPETGSPHRRHVSTPAGWFFARGSAAQTRLAPLAPSPLAGEGTMVFPRIRMGEGFLAVTHPSPLIVRGSTEPPSPARGEGTIMRTALVVLFTLQTATSFPPRVFTPGLCIFASPTRSTGGRSEFDESSSLASMCSQQKNSLCGRKIQR
jgi:hypothetical protein